MKTNQCGCSITRQIQLIFSEKQLPGFEAYSAYLGLSVHIRGKWENSQRGHTFKRVKSEAGLSSSNIIMGLRK